MPTMSIDQLESWLKSKSKDSGSYKGPMPNTAAGLPGLAVQMDPSLLGTNTLGYVKSSNLLSAKDENRARPQTVFLSPEADHKTVGHEAEHLLARQNLGFSQSTREKFDELLDKKWSGQVDSRNRFLNGLVEAIPYLKEKYGIEDGYLTPEFIKKQGRVGMYEILATLGGAESSLGVDLTKDPELRKNMFKDRNVREAYNAVTGLRQTRLDPRDIPPYTRVEEPVEPGMMGKLKRMMGYAEGGYVENAGNSKLI